MPRQPRLDALPLFVRKLRLASLTRSHVAEANATAPPVKKGGKSPGGAKGIFPPL